MNISNPSVQVALIVAVACVAGLAVWLGSGFKLKWGKGGGEVEVKKRDVSAGPSKVVVAEKLEAEDAKLGNITGAQAKGPGGALSVPNSVEVAREAKFKNTETGDITGISYDGGSGKGPGKCP